MSTYKLAWSLVVASAVATAACGESKSSMNPVAPSAVVIGAQADQVGGGEGWSTTGKPTSPGKPDNPGNGNGNGNGHGNDNGGGGNGNGNQPPSVPAPSQPPSNTSPSTTRKVEIEGLISAKSGGAITVNAQSIAVPATCVIRHGGTQFTLADLSVGDRVHVKGTRTTTGTGATAVTTIEASEVKLQNPGGEGDDDDDDDDDDEAPVSQLVSVTALDATASETGPDLGAFRFTRSGDTTAALTVTFTLTGTATNGTDYQNVPLTVTFAAGQATANVIVVPVSDTTAEGSETVILTVVDGTGYDAGSPATATVTIAG